MSFATFGWLLSQVFLATEETPLLVRQRGGQQLFINTGPQDEYPAPAGAYLKAGFKIAERATTHLLLRSLR